jgi:uroporphyrinogen decarboxylase
VKQDEDRILANDALQVLLATEGAYPRQGERFIVPNKLGIAPDSNLQRLLKAIRFEKTDRVPNWEVVIEARNTEYLVGKKVRSGSLPVDDMVKLALMTGMDAIHAPTVRVSGDMRGLGELWRTEEDGSITYMGGTIKREEDLALLDLDQIRHDWLLLADRVLDESVQAVRGTAVGVAGRLDGPFWQSQTTMGLEDSLVAVIDDPTLFLRIMDFYVEYERELARLFVEKGIPLIMMSDDLAHSTGLLVSPAWLKNEWMPRMKVIMEPLVNRDVATVFHSCGKLDEVIPLLIGLGCSGVQALQPNCNDIYAVRRRYGTRIALMGNIDITFPLSTGKPSEVRKDVLEHLDRLGRGGGYIVGSSHSVLNSIPPENFVEMIRTVQEWR